MSSYSYCSSLFGPSFSASRKRHLRKSWFEPRPKKNWELVNQNWELPELGAGQLVPLGRRTPLIPDWRLLAEPARATDLPARDVVAASPGQPYILGLSQYLSPVDDG